MDPGTLVHAVDPLKANSLRHTPSSSQSSFDFDGSHHDLFNCKVRPYSCPEAIASADCMESFFSEALVA